MRYLLLATCAVLSGCVPYPVYKQLQPETHVRVVDQAGAAIPRANVTLLSNTYPYGREHHRETLATDENGQVSFKSRREWRTEALMIHGWEEFFWNVCVFHSGYTTHLTRHRSANTFGKSMTIVIEQGESKPCPTPKIIGSTEARAL